MLSPERRSWNTWKSSNKRRHHVGFTKDYRAIPSLVAVGSDCRARWESWAHSKKCCQGRLLTTPRKTSRDYQHFTAKAFFSPLGPLSINWNLADAQKRFSIMPSILHWTKEWSKNSLKISIPLHSTSILFLCGEWKLSCSKKTEEKALISFSCSMRCLTIIENKICFSLDHEWVSTAAFTLPPSFIVFLADSFHLYGCRLVSFDNIEREKSNHNIESRLRQKPLNREKKAQFQERAPTESWDLCQYQDLT